MLAPAPPPRASRREWTGLTVIALPCLLYSMDLTVFNLAVPHLRADLNPTSAQLLWIVDIYGFLVAGSLITIALTAAAATMILLRDPGDRPSPAPQDDDPASAAAG